MVKRVSHVGKHFKVSLAAAEAFKAALPLRPHREQALADHSACAGVDGCETCKAYEDHVEIITRELDLGVYSFHPIDAADVPSAPWYDAAQAQEWDRGRELYLALCEAADVKPVKRVEIGDLIWANVVLRWIERTMRVPDGSTVGKRLRLREFQRNVVRKTYGSGFGAHSKTVRQALEKRLPHHYAQIDTEQAHSDS
jgi:hypothetical protein